ncbi:MAG: hypothetical protein JRJ39_12240 [Deltaproteobacteria bacterium]|nr:hypothetical protein [Deltaproteobacteria bacterium]
MTRARVIPSCLLVIVMFAFFCQPNFAQEKTAKDKETSGKTSPSIKTPKPLGTLSDIGVDKVWLDSQCVIQFKLRNKGKYVMANDVHKKGVVRVYFGKSYEDFPFTMKSKKGKTAIDPMGALKRPNKTVSYNTSIRLGKGLSVRVIMVQGSKGAQLKSAKSLNLTLTPKCKVLAEKRVLAPVSAADRAARSQVRADKRVLAPDSTADKTDRSQAEKGNKDDPPGSPSTPPVEIYSPRDGHRFFLRSPIQVQWSSPYCEAFKIIVLKNGSEEFSMPLKSYCGYTKSEEIPNSHLRFISGTDYQLRVEYYENVVSSDGSRTIPEFRAEDTTGYLTFINNYIPRSGCDEDQTVFLHIPTAESLRFRIGDTMEIQWCHFPRSVGEVRLSLVRDSRYGGGSWSIQRRIAADRFSYDWTIPATVSPGEGYRVRVRDLDGSDDVSVSMYPFTIDPGE